MGYRETESAAVREELAKCISERPCPDCGGARLNRAARNVFVADRALSSIVVLPIDEALDFFGKLALSGWRGEIAARYVEEIRERLNFLVDVGLDYLTLERKADTLSGGEARRRPGVADRRRPGRRDVRAGRAVDRSASS